MRELEKFINWNQEGVIDASSHSRRRRAVPCMGRERSVRTELIVSDRRREDSAIAAFCGAIIIVASAVLVALSFWGS